MFYKWRRMMATAIGCLVFSSWFAGCASRPKDERVDQKTPALPPLSTDEKSFASYQPEKSYTALGTSLLGRTVFEGDGPPGYQIGVRDWKVSPGKHTGAMTLPGAAFFEVRSGEGSLSTGGQMTDLKLGSTFSISQGQQFELSSSEGLPLSLRLYLVTAR
jgi:hypothetical protein